MKLLTVIVWFLKKLGYKYTISVEKNDKMAVFTSEKMECDPNEPLHISGNGRVGIGT